MWGNRLLQWEEGISKRLFPCVLSSWQTVWIKWLNSTCQPIVTKNAFSKAFIFESSKNSGLFLFFYLKSLGNVPSLFISVKMFHAAHACHVRQVFDGSLKNMVAFSIVWEKRAEPLSCNFQQEVFVVQGGKKARRRGWKSRDFFY